MFDELIQGIQFFLGRHDLKLMEPQGLLLLFAIPVFVVLGLWMGRDLRWYRRVLVQLLRAGVILALALALSRPVKISNQRNPAVVLLADLSDSMSIEARQQMEKEIVRFWNQRGESDTFLVGFGQSPQLLAKPRTRRLGGLGRGAGSPATDIAAALRFTYSLFPPLHDRRVVIFSDGEETRGDLLAEAARARELGIEVSAVPILPTLKSDARVDAVDAPAVARAGEQIPVEVGVFSSAGGRLAVQLLVDGKKVERRVWRAPKGTSRVSFTATLEGEGWHDLAARVGSHNDRYADNNTAITRVHVSGRPRVWLVQSGTGQNALRSLLEKQDLEMKVSTREDMPANLKELAEQDLLILDDLPLSDLPPASVDVIRSYVEDFGGGLLITVGQAASDLAGPEDAPIEKLLPVHFRQVKKKEKMPAALAFVLDRSSSMSRGEKFVILLRAVVDALDRIKDTAQIAVVMFDDFPEVVVPLTEAGQRDKIRKVVLAQRVGGGTSIYPALEAAHKELKKSAAKLKHIILLSDGQSISIYAHYGYLVDRIARSHVTVTTIALGDDADHAELKRIAARTSGRFYFADSMSNVPKIFTAETETITEDNVVEQAIRAVPAKLVEVLAGIDFAGSPVLKGYVASEARPTSEVLLTSSDRSEPLLARWRFGLGRVAVMTTDAHGEWAGDWPTWDGFSLLWPRLVRDTMRISPPGSIRASAKREGERGVLTVRVPSENPYDPPVAPELFVKDPRGQEEELRVVRRGLGVYRAEFELDQLGPYGFRAQRTGKEGASEVAFASLSHTYREEYLSARGNPELLQAVSETTGGILNPEPGDVFSPGRQEREKHEEQWPPLTFLALACFLAEVLLRRL